MVFFVFFYHSVTTKGGLNESYGLSADGANRKVTYLDKKVVPMANTICISHDIRVLSSFAPAISTC